MVKYYFNLIAFCLLITHVCFAQEATFSKRYTALGDRVRDLVLLENQITVSCQNSCPLDTLLSISCSSINTFDFNGELLSSILIDSLFPEGDDRLWFDNNTFYFTGHPHGQGAGRPTSLQLFTPGLLLQSSSLIPSLPGGIINNEGVMGNETHLYFYGKHYEPSTSKTLGYITKLDRQTLEPIWQKKYPSSQRINDFYCLQWTIDSNLVLLNERNNGAGSGSNAHYELIKLDTAGNVLNERAFEEIGITPQRLLSASTGDFYFSSAYEPDPDFPMLGGFINKLSADFEQVEWSLEFPSDPFTDGREYIIHDFYETTNGDIVVCGTVWDATDGTVLDLHGTWNGFIGRVSPQGELRWVKVYQIPSYLTPQTEFGRYKTSILRKIVETPSGGFITVGDIGYKSRQIQELGAEGLEREIWLLSVDSTGCIAGEECQEVIVLDGINASEARFDIGTKWTYEVEFFSPPTIKYRTYEVIGLTTINDTLAYVIDSEPFFGLEYMYVSGDSIYFWNDKLDFFQLNFDFSATTEYQTIWAGQCYSQETGDAFVVVDSIRQLSLAGGTLDIQHLDITYSSTYGDLAAKIYTDIGNDYNFKLGLAEDCDVNRYITKLRCFENNETNYNFVGYPCDSTFVIVNTNEIAPIEPYSVYPNPSKGEVNVKGFTGKKIDYALFDVVGRPVQQGPLQNGKLYIENPGVYLLLLNNRGVTQSVKLVILD